MKRISPVAGKIEQLDYDLILAADDKEQCFCLSYRSWLMLISLTSPMHWSTRWKSPTDAELDLDLIDQWATQVERELMMWDGCNSGCNCIPCGALTRWTITGVFQILLPGASDWIDFPSGDTRNTVTAYPQPTTPEGQTSNCYAANNFVANFHALMDDWIAQLTTVGTVIAWIDALATFLTPFTGGISLPVGAVIAAVAGLFGAGSAALDGAWSEEAYHKLFCCALEEIPETGEIDADVIENIRSCFRSEIGGTAADSLDVVQIFEGVIAFANMAKVPIDPEHECDECVECSDCASSHVEPDPAWTNFHTPPTGWSLVNPEYDTGFNYLKIELSNGNCEIHWPAKCVASILIFLSGNSCDFTMIGGSAQTFDNIPATGVQVLTLIPNEVVTGITIHSDGVSSISNFQLTVCD